MNTKSISILSVLFSVMIFIGCNTGDKNAPVITIMHPNETSSFIPGDTAHIHVNIVEDEAMHEITVTVMNTETSVKSLDTTVHAHDLSITFMTDLILDVPAHSNHMLTVTAEDEAGNIGTESMHFHVTE